MRASPLFFAFSLLLSTAVLAYFGAYALAPLPDDGSSADVNELTATPLEYPEIVFGNPSIGPSGAFVTIVEYGDFLCSACATMEEPLRKALTEFAGRIRLVWKDLPNTNLHPEAFKAAVAARCADRQGRFWEYHDLLFANQNAVNDAAYTIFAEQLNLNVGDFALCLDTQATKYIVQQDIEQAIRLRVDATPYLFIGENRISGALTETQLVTYLRLELAKAEQALGLPAADPSQ